MTHAIYNEIEPFAGSWLEALADRGAIAPGRVERRSIADLVPADVAGPGQRHFFAGIGVWSYALRLAGVPDDASIWTGSCPCQPFSAAGKGLGVDDPRHLWPAWFRLIAECRPAVVFGEQVASPAGLAWLDAVYADLEGAGYAVGAADLCAAGVGAPHIRQRLYFVAYAVSAGRTEWWTEPRNRSTARRGSSSDMADADASGFGELGREKLRAVSNASLGHDADGCSPASSMADAGQEQRGPASEQGSHREDAPERHEGTVHDQQRSGVSSAGRLADSDVSHAIDRREPRSGGLVQPAPYAAAGFWSECDWIECTDGVSRPVEPGTFPLAHGAPARVGRLRGYGNGLVSEQAAAFIKAALDAGEQVTW